MWLHRKVRWSEGGSRGFWVELEEATLWAWIGMKAEARDQKEIALIALSRRASQVSHVQVRWSAHVVPCRRQQRDVTVSWRKSPPFLLGCFLYVIMATVYIVSKEIVFRWSLIFGPFCGLFSLIFCLCSEAKRLLCVLRKGGVKRRHSELVHTQYLMCAFPKQWTSVSLSDVFFFFTLSFPSLHISVISKPTFRSVMNVFSLCGESTIEHVAW